jgi:DNA-binding response OmpR family regulator
MNALLLVDDAPEIALIVQRFSRRAGQNVVTFPDAESAWHHLQVEVGPHLAIFDLNLPGASGADLCRQVRGEPRLAGLRVALFSHWDRPRDIAAGLDAGVDYVLSKDLLVQPEAWSARLAEILPPASGQPPPLSLRWKDTQTLVRGLNEALAALARAPLGMEIVCDLVRRAARRTGASPLLNRSLSADGLGLRPERAPDAPALEAFLIACVHQTWCLLGSAGCERYRSVLQDPPSPAAEISSPS